MSNMKRFEFRAASLQEAQAKAALTDIENHDMTLVRAFITRQTDGTYLVNLTYHDEEAVHAHADFDAD